jgi:hypothetical protein
MKYLIEKPPDNGKEYKKHIPAYYKTVQYSSSIGQST